MQIGVPYSPYRTFTGIVIPEGLLAYKPLSLASKVCLARLWRYCGRRNYCWPSQDELANQLGVSERTVRNYLTELEEQGFVEVRQQGLNKPNIYVMLGHPSLMESEDEDDPLGPANNSGQERQITTPVDRPKNSGPLKSVCITTESSTESTSYPEEGIQLFHGEGNDGVRSLDSEIGLPEFRRLFEKRRFKHISAKERREATELWGDRTVSEEHATEVLDYLVRVSLSNPVDFLHAVRLVLREDVSRGGGSAARARRQDASDEPSVIPPHPPIAPSVSNRVPVPIGDDGLPEPVRAWNHTVKSGNALNLWKTTNGDHSRLVAAWQDPDFRDNLDRILAKAERIIAADPAEHGWLTFTWLFKVKDNNPNWFRILQGEYDYMSKKSESGSSRKSQGEKNFEVTQRVRAKLMKEIEEKRLHGNTAS